MSKEDTQIASVKSIPFSGIKPRKYREWHKKVLAFGKTKGWALALTDDADPKCTEKMKDAAINFLTMSLTDKAFAFVEHKSSPTAVWQELREEYSPGDDIDVYDLQEDFSEARLRAPDENPTDWFMRVEHISELLADINEDLRKDDEEFKIHIKVNLPKTHYSELLTTIRAGFRTMTYKELKKAVKAHWRAFTRTKEEEEKNMDVDETVLAAEDVQDEKPAANYTAYKQFKGRCHNCGGIGHKARDCPSNTSKGRNGNVRKSYNKKSGKFFKGKCYICNRYGHMARDCKSIKRTNKERNMFVGATHLVEKDVEEANEQLNSIFVLEEEPGWKTVPFGRKKSFTELSNDEKFEEWKYNNGYSVLCEDCCEETDLPSVGDPPLEDEEDQSIARLFALPEEDEMEKVNAKRKLNFGDDDVSNEKHEIHAITHHNCCDETQWKRHRKQYCNEMLQGTKVLDDNVSSRKFQSKRNSRKKGSKNRRTKSRARKSLNMEKPRNERLEGNPWNESDDFWIRKNELRICRRLLTTVYDELAKDIEAKVKVSIANFHAKLQSIMDTYRYCNHSQYRNVMELRRELRWRKNSIDPLNPKIYMSIANTSEKRRMELIHAVGESYGSGTEKWLMDSGSTVHVTTNKTYMFNLNNCSSTVTVGTGNTIKALFKGSIMLRQQITNKLIILHDVLYVPGFSQNIVSISNLLQRGYTMEGTSDKLRLKQKSKSVDIYNTDAQNMFYFLCTRCKNVHHVRNNHRSYSSSVQVKNFDNGIRRTELAKERAMDNSLRMNKINKSMDINIAHDSFGHMDEKRLRKFCEKEGIRLTGKLRTCVGCMEAKAKRKAVRKMTETRAKKPCERIFVDTSGPYPRSLNGNKYWFKIKDDYSRKTWNYFLKKKNEVPNLLIAFIEQMKENGKVISKIRCDNAGEHQRFVDICRKNKITIEYVAPNTPQHNGVVERSFTTDLWRLKAMMRQARFKKSYMNWLWPYGIKILEKLENMSMSTVNPGNNSPDSLFGEESPRIASHLIQFGRIGFVAYRAKIRGKMKPRSMRCIMVGYASNHAADTYLMFNPRTRKIIMSRDIRWADFNRPSANEELEIYSSGEEDDIQTWQPGNMEPSLTSLNDSNIKQEILNQGGGNDNNSDNDADKTIPDDDDDDDEDDYIKMYSETSPQEDKPTITEIEDDDTMSNEREEEDDIEMEKDANELETQESSDTEMDERRVTRSMSNRNRIKRIRRALHRLDTSYNPTAPKRLRERNNHIHATNDLGHKIYNTAIISDPGEPSTIKEAMNGKEKKLWIPSIKNEVMNFIKRKSWEYVSVKEPKELNRKMIPCKWVFKIKNEQDGSKRYKSRLCVKGFHQVPGVDYTESFSPVATESTIHILLVYTLWKYKNGWKCEMFDVEAAFLNANLETAMYLRWPEGMKELGFITEDEQQNKCIKLVRSMYGNIDAALRWQKCFVETCIDPKGEIKCEQSKVDPCLLLKRNQKKEIVLLIVCYVDDVLLSGKQRDIDDFRNKFKKKYNITNLGTMKKHLGMWYEWRRDKNNNPYIKVTMDKMLKDIVMSYEKCIGKKVKSQKTPGIPNKFLTKIKEDEEIIKQKEYRSLVGKILYYVNKMDVACANAIRELTQHLENPGAEQWKAMQRIVGYLSTRIGKGRIVRGPKELRIVGWTDSDYAKAEDRKSISGNMTTIGGSIIHGMSKGQNCVCLSSTEAEYVAMSTLAQEIRFEQQLLDEIAGQEHLYPSIIFEDNVGAIFLSQNKQVGQRTKHIDIRDHFIREMIDTKKMVVQFTRSEDNYADILTKNVNLGLFDKHSKQIDQGLLEYEHLKDEKVMSIFDRCGCCKKQQQVSVNENNDDEETNDRPMDENEEVMSIIDNLQNEEIIVRGSDIENQDETSIEDMSLDGRSESEMIEYEMSEISNEDENETDEETIVSISTITMDNTEVPYLTGEEEEALNEEERMNYEIRRAEYINSQMLRKGEMLITKTAKYLKFCAKEIARQEEEWRQEAKREMMRIEEAEIDNQDRAAIHTLYWEGIMAQRDQVTRMRREEWEILKKQEQHHITRQMILFRRELEDPESVDHDMSDYRDDHDDFTMDLLLTMDERRNRRRLSNDRSYFDEQGEYVRTMPWKKRVHYARKNDNT